jgi:hypothetical protein
MPIANYQGPANSTDILPHLLGEKIAACFVDNAGHIWLVVESGHAVVFGGFDAAANAFWTAPPQMVQQVKDERKASIEERIQKYKNLAPGLF